MFQINVQVRLFSSSQPFFKRRLLFLQFYWFLHLVDNFFFLELNLNQIFLTLLFEVVDNVSWKLKARSLNILHFTSSILYQQANDSCMLRYAVMLILINFKSHKKQWIPIGLKKVLMSSQNSQKFQHIYIFHLGKPH